MPKYIPPLAPELTFDAGDVLLVRSDASVQVPSTSPTLVKEAQIGKPGTLRIQFLLVNGYLGTTTYGQIYRNGVAVGPLHSVSNYDSKTFTDDISGWNIGDRVQLYVWTTTTGPGNTTSNFRIYVKEYYGAAITVG
jgi:hypothetical protein